MSDGKEVTDRTKPPKDCQYVTWCNDCEEAVTNEDAACVECSSLDLEYFIRESDHDRIVAELKRELLQYYQIAESGVWVETGIYEEQIKTIAELRAQVEWLERALEMSSSSPEDRSQEAAHYNWVDDQMEKLETTIATQARVIEKLKEELVDVYEGHRFDVDEMLERVAAIEKEGAKDG